MRKLPLGLNDNFILVLICLFFLFTRFYKITEIPASVYWDEASIGYNAYSILKTGRDEWGEFLPLHFRAFGEFKLPVYIYAVVLVEFIFGLNTLAVRFPSVIFGLFSIIGLYFLMRKLTDNKLLAFLSSFLFSITPWFYIFSRTGYEATAGLAFFIWALYFLVKKNLIFSTLLFVVSAYSYNSFRILSPLLIGGSFFYFLLKKRYLAVIVSVAILFLGALPIYKLYKQDFGLSRLQAVGSPFFIDNYLKNFSPDYLFVSGDINPRNQMPGKSQLYFIDLMFLSLGFFYILKSKNLKLFLILVLLILAPVPAAITKENPHALRSILMSPILSVISAMGIYYIFIFSKSNKILLAAIIGIYLIFFQMYILNFSKNYNFLSKSAWQFEYKEIFGEQKNGCVEDKHGQPYIFALYYNKIDPDYFVSTKVLNPVSDWGFSTIKSFGNYIFLKTCKK